MPIIPSATAADQALWASRQDTRLTAASGQAASSGAQSAAEPGREKKTKEAGQQFEALYLRQMLEEWMPKDSDDLFGDKTAGPVWRSMLVDSMATTLSKSGTIGIAQMIFKPDADGSKGK
ncbi:MAG: rod-binding protein [Hyphomicrobium sp.]